MAQLVVHPVDDARLAAQHDGRFGLQRDSQDLAVGAVLLQGFGDGGGDQPVGRELPAAGVVLQPRDRGVVDQRDAQVLHVVAPVRGHDAVGRGHAPCRDRSQRRGGHGLLAVVGGAGEAGAALGEPAEPAVAEVGCVALQILGTHRSHDDLNDQRRLFGPYRERESAAEQNGQDENFSDIEFHGVQKYAFLRGVRIPSPKYFLRESGLRRPRPLFRGRSPAPSPAPAPRPPPAAAPRSGARLRCRDGAAGAGCS